MPSRNLIALVACTLGCLAVWVARARDHHGSRFNEALAIIDRWALDPVPAPELLEAAVDAAVGRLDEHSAFIRGTARGEFEALLDQEFGGVGLDLAADDTGEMVVVSPVVGGPAWQAGIAPGDRIVAIDGGSVRGVPVAEVVTRLRGPAGEPVTLRIVPPREPAGTLDPRAADGTTAAARDVTLVRGVVRTDSVRGDRRREDGGWEWLVEGEPGVALIRITSFGERTADELDAALAALPATGLRGLVIDLRGNPGGLVSAAVEVCDRFLDEGVIVTTRGRRAAGADEAPREERRATAGAMLSHVPLAVLVDELTASAAEIVAACLQDHGRAVVVGSRTIGKGTVQSLLPLSGDVGLLKLTTAEYVRPSGAAIHRGVDAAAQATWGVAPDEGGAVSPPAADLARLRRWRTRRDAAWPPERSAVRPVDVARPREIDAVLRVAIDRFAADSAARPDLGGEKEAARDADRASASGE